MKVNRAIELAKAWVEVEGSQIPGFLGAHLLGSINGLAKNALFPSCWDIDIRVVLQEENDRENRTLSYQGLMLDVSFGSPEDYRSPAVVLSNPGLAPHMAAATILSDPTNLLQKIHQSVKNEYHQRQWVAARCEKEKQFALPASESSEISVLGVSFALMYLGGLVAVADLKTPTHRRSLILMKEILQAYGQPTVPKEALRILGSAQMTHAQVSAYLPDVAEAFNRAVAVYRTPIPFVGYKLQPHLKPYYVEASQEMIDEGHHREAMQWILHAFVLTNTAIQNDAPAAEKLYFQAKYDHLMQALGWSKSQDWQSRYQRLQNLTTQLFKLTNWMVANNPMIND